MICNRFSSEGCCERKQSYIPSKLLLIRHMVSSRQKYTDRPEAAQVMFHPKPNTTCAADPFFNHFMRIKVLLPRAKGSNLQPDFGHSQNVGTPYDACVWRGKRHEPQWRRTPLARVVRTPGATHQALRSSSVDRPLVDRRSLLSPPIESHASLVPRLSH